MAEGVRTLAPAAPAAPADAALHDGHHLARGAAANTLVLLAANFRAVFTFLIARLLGEAALGRFGLAFATTELLSKAGMLGLDNAIVPFVAPRAAAGDRAGSRHVFRRAATLATLSSIALALISIPIVGWVATRRGIDAFSHGEALMLLALPGIAVSRIATGASRSVLAMSNEFYSRGLAETWVTTGVFVVAMAIGFRDRAPALAVAIGSTAGGLVAFVLASQALNRRIGQPHAGGSVASVSGAAGRSAGEMLRFSLPISGSSLLTVLVMQADVLLLGAFVNRAPGVTAEAFGVFCAAAEIAGGLRKVRQIFDPIFAPIVATRAVSVERAALRETVAGPGRWVLAAQLPLVGALMLAGGTIMSIYGPGFRTGAMWLALLALAHGANTFAGLVETLLMIERPMLNLVNATITVAVQIVTGVILIPRLGVTGAALSMCIGFSVQGVLRFVEVRQVFGWSWPWASLTRPILACALAVVPAVALRVGLGPRAEIPAALIFLGAYAAAWWRFGADPADRQVWQRLLKRS